MHLSARHFLKLALMVLALSWAVVAQAETVTVFAAASLKTVLDDLRPAFEKKTGDELRLVYAGSSALARQIGQGAPADVFISANVDWMDLLEKQGATTSESRVDLVGNQLVLISTSHEDPLAPASLVTLEGRIAMGLVTAVPAGIYGKQALENLALWDALSARVVQTDNVRAALALVARGEVDFGIVYASDAAAEPRVQSLAVFEASTHSPIVYPAALTSRAGTTAAAYLRFLQSGQARESFEIHGFSLPEQRP